MDSDVIESPPSLIQDLASHDKPIIVPNCMQRFINDDGKRDVRAYDFNTWVDSQVAQDLWHEVVQVIIKISTQAHEEPMRLRCQLRQLIFRRRSVESMAHKSGAVKLLKCICHAWLGVCLG